MARGSLITFEGGEGVGKSTQIQRLKVALEAVGLSVVVTREPGGTRLAELIRGLVREEELDPPCEQAEVLLFLAARAQLVRKVIAPALAAGRWVLCDRFSDSTFAYQGYGRGLELSVLQAMNDFACASLRPDLTFLLDAPPEKMVARLRARENETGENADRFERAGMAFHQRLRTGFLELARAEPKRFHVLDAGDSVEAIGEKIWNLTKPFV